MALAISCVLTCAGYAQEPSTAPQQPSSSTSAAGNQSSAAAAPAPGAMPTPPAPPPPRTVPGTDVVPLSEPVLTLKGACKPEAASTTPPPGCVSSLTREQFEKLVKALTPPDRPPMPADVMRNFATQYAKLLTFSDAARSMGLENDPRVLQIMQFAKNQILTEALNQHVTQEFSHPTDQQIEDYYKENSKKYVEATLQRIIIPRNQGSAEKPKPSDEEQTAYAEKIRQEWVAGGDPEKLEKEATEHAGSSMGGVSVNVGARRPGSLPEAHESVFDLKAGEISPVFSDPASFYIYKVVSVRTVPLSEAKTSITTTLQRQLVADKIQQIQSSVTPVLNDTYFGPEKQPGPITPRIINPHGGGHPGAGAETPPPPPPSTGNPPPQNTQPPPQ